MNKLKEILKKIKAALVSDAGRNFLLGNIIIAKGGMSKKQQNEMVDSIIKKIDALLDDNGEVILSKIENVANLSAQDIVKDIINAVAPQFNKIAESQCQNFNELLDKINALELDEDKIFSKLDDIEKAIKEDGEITRADIANAMYDVNKHGDENTDKIIKHIDESIATSKNSSGTEELKIDVVDGIARVTRYDGCAKSVEIPSIYKNNNKEYSVAIIKGNAFKGKKQLEDITIPNSVTKIGKYAFFDCNSLSTVYYKGELNEWLGIEFEDETANPMHKAKELIINSHTLNGELVIPDEVKSINDYAFLNCKGFTKVTIPASVEYIGAYAFKGCNNKLQIFCQAKSKPYGWDNNWNPDNRPVYWGQNGSTPKGENATSDITAAVDDSKDAVNSEATDSDKNDTTSTSTGGSKKSVTPKATGSSDFDYDICQGGIRIKRYIGNAKDVVIPSLIAGKRVTSIGSHAFQDCKGLTSITIPDSVTSIGDWAFCGCSALKSIVIPDRVTRIGNWAFSYCTGLTRIIIPDSVKRIGEYAFHRCGELTIYCEAARKPLRWARQWNPDNRPVYWGQIIGGTKAKKNTGFLREHKMPIVLIAAVIIALIVIIPIAVHFSERVGYDLDENGTLTIYGSGEITGEIPGDGVKNVIIEEGITRIGKGVFRSCDGMTSITIPDSVTCIDGWAFFSCSGLTDVYYQGDLSGWLGIEFDGFDSNPMEYADNLYINGELLQGELVIPEGTEKIGDYAFYGCSDLTSITIPDSVTSIGYEAFYGCTGLTSVTIGDGVTSVAENAFSGCTLIEKATMPALAIGYIPRDSLTAIEITCGEIADYAFSGCTGLTNATIGDGVTSIGSYAFYNCSNLTSITIPDSVTSIGDSAFSDCTGLTSVTIGDGVTSVAENAFSGCTLIEKATMPALAIGAIPKDSLTTVKITSGDRIGEGAFRDCSTLTSITFPDSLMIIDSSAFYNCTGLTNITIPDSVTSIGDYAFWWCTGLTDVYYQGDLLGWLGIEFDSSDSNPMYYASNLYINGELLQGELVIPEGTEKIGSYAFYNCSNLTSVTIPDSVTSIGNYAFRDCTGLMSVTIGDGVTSIGSYAFYNCSNLTSITIPDSVTSIGFYAFGDCTGLTSINISDSVTSIGYSAFDGCSALTSITIPDSVTSIGTYAFYNCSGLTDVYYQGDLSGWLGIEFDGLYSNPMEHASNLYINGELLQGELVIPEGTEKIGSYAFYNCSNLTSVTIPDSVTSIGNYAFRDCTGLMSVTIGDGVTSIGSYAFSGCTGLTSIAIPDSVTSIGYYAFSGCTGLTSITIPDSVTSIGYDAFDGCTGLTDVYYRGDLSGWLGIEFGGYASNPMEYASNLYINGELLQGELVIPEGTKKIGSHAFHGCDVLTSIMIPDSVTSIGDGAFFYCTGLTSITIPDSVTSIGDRAFYSCSGLTSITIPDSVTSIGDWAFYGCTGLKSITIPNSVTNIGTNPFIDCSKLTSLIVGQGNEVYHSTGNCLIETACKTLIAGCSNSVIPSDGSVTSIGDWAFWSCTGLTSITIPDSVTSIGDDAFVGCRDLTDIIFQGTMEQWNVISKGTDWDYNTLDYTVTCTDGVLDKSGRQIG